MSVVWHPSSIATAEPSGAHATQRTLASVVVITAALFNFVLCFINTTLFPISANVVIAAEIALIGIALSLVWHRGRSLYSILLLMAAYFITVMVFRSDFDPKILRDLLIPIVFFFLGRYLGDLRSADRLVMLLLIFVLGTALFEWLALDTYLRFLDVYHYYVARGTTIEQADTAAGLFHNATRYEERTLLSFLGDHRVSGIFLEPVSVGNFGAIAFAWVLLRDRQRIFALAAKTLAIAAILVLADARFGFFLCVITLAIYASARVIRPTMLLALPFVTIIALVTDATVNRDEIWDNTIAGRLLSAGHSITTLDALNVFGLQLSDAISSNYAGDSGYAYALVTVGIIGLAAIWGLFVYTPVSGTDACRFKNFVAFYVVLLLTISASVFSIKTAALLWFLYGTLNNPNRADMDNLFGNAPQDSIG